MALKGHLVAGQLVGPLAGIESGSANDLVSLDGSAVAHTESLSAYLDRTVSNTPGTILYRGASAWDDLAPADGYLKNTSGVLSWGAVAAPPKWQLIETRTVNGDEDFTNLDGYQEIGIILSNVGASASGIRSIRVSDDNGTTFKATSGDYYAITDTIGGITGKTELRVHAVAASSGAYGSLFIRGFSLASPKLSSDAGGQAFVASTTALNAIRLFNLGGGNPNSGTAYLIGLPGS